MRVLGFHIPGLIAIALLGTVAGAMPESTPQPADKLVGAAVKKAKSQKKVVFVDFSASW